MVELAQVSPSSGLVVARSTLGLAVNVFVDEWVMGAGGLRYNRTLGTHNLIVTAGRNLVRDLLADKATAGASPSDFAAGTGSTAVAASDTALVAEVFRDALTDRVKTDGQLLLTYYLTTASANGSTLREIGLFNANPGGTMFARALLSEAIVKDSLKAYTFNWYVNITAEV